MTTRLSRRVLSAALSLVTFALLFGFHAPVQVFADNTWPRFPTDAEIDEAWARYEKTSLVEIGQHPGAAVVEKKIYKMKSGSADPTRSTAAQRSYFFISFGVTHPDFPWPGVPGSVVKGSATTWFMPDLVWSAQRNQWEIGGNGFVDNKAGRDAWWADYSKSLKFTEGWATDEPSPSPSVTSGPPPPCAAKIDAPAGLKAGDTLSPSVTVSSSDGKPVQGTVAPVLYINGVQANSVQWDGKPARILLQLSCQGYAQEFQATYDGKLVLGPTTVRGTGTPAPSPSVTQTPRPSTTPTIAITPTGTPSAPGTAGPTGRTGNAGRAAAPGLGGVGNVPGPTDATQGVLGVVGPGVLGILGGLLAGLAGGGPTAPTAPGGPVAPGGPPSGGGQAPVPGGTPTAGKDGPPPVAGDAATQAVRDQLGWLNNRANALKNPAMADAIARAQADAFDKNGNVIPDKWTALRDDIRKVAGMKPGSALDAYYQIPEALRAPTDTLLVGAKTVGQFVGEVGGAAVTVVKGIGSGISSAAHGLAQIADAAYNYKMFGKGLDANMKQFVAGSAGAEVKESNQALHEGRYLDALGASARGTAKVAGALVSAAGGKLWGAAREAMPVDEIKSLADPNASLEEKLWAVPAAAVKVAGMLLGTEAGVKPVPGISRNTTFIPSAAPGYAAGQAARTAAAEASAATSSAARAAAEGRQAAAAAAQKVEQGAADVLGGQAAPNRLSQGQRILAQNPELRNAIDDAIRADGGSGSLHGLRQNGAMSADAQNLITARKTELQNEAMNAAGKRIAAEETAGRLAAGEPPPGRIITAEATEGNRSLATGANTRTDLDRTHLGLKYVDGTRARQILNEEVGNLQSGSGRGFAPEAIDTNVYTPPPGRLSDASGAAPNSDAWLQRGLQRTSGKSGYHPVYVAKDGAVTVGDHVGGAAGGEALPMSQRLNAPVQLSAVERAESVAHQIEGLNKAATENNVSGGVKFAARAIKDGASFDGPADAVMRAAMTKDPAEQLAILNEAGIRSVADLRARTQMR